MPANLTADYLAAEQAFKHAHTHEEKIAALEQMYATLPKHKGTEKMQAEIKRRLSDARKDSQKHGGHHAAPAYFIRREGAAQVALIGPPNSGKSALLAALTHARPEIAAYPFTTRLPLPGMMPFEDVRIQLVDTPAMSAEYMEPWMAQVVRAAQMSVLVIDPNEPGVLDAIEFVLMTVEGWRVPVPRLVAGNKLDQEGAAANFAAIQSLYGDRFRYLAVSAAAASGLNDFARETFRCLDLVRFYSKAPGHKPDLDVPYVLQRGATVADAAAQVHRDFAEHLKYARLFHPGNEHEGRMVDRTHLLEDRDVLEFHAEH